VFLIFIIFNNIKVNKAKVYYLIFSIFYLAYINIYNLIEKIIKVKAIAYSLS
jgi:hypothetical protein